ncbi:MAG: hypothetical protein HKN43_16355 [Rhodothermales bacterium]|nr:hypothetical protein [Rhodothermales bacterium]
MLGVVIIQALIPHPSSLIPHPLITRGEGRVRWDRRYSRCVGVQYHRSFFLANAYRQLGRTEDAIAQYEVFLSTERHDSIYDDANLLKPSLLSISALYIEIGEIDKAIENLSRFVELWQDADAELQPRVQAAREQIDRLLSEKARES